MRIGSAATQFSPGEGREPGIPPGNAPFIMAPMSNLRHPSGGAKSESGRLVFSTEVTSNLKAPFALFAMTRIGKKFLPLIADSHALGACGARPIGPPAGGIPMKLPSSSVTQIWAEPSGPVTTYFVHTYPRMVSLTPVSWSVPRGCDAEGCPGWAPWPYWGIWA